MTNLNILINLVDADHNFQDNPADFEIMDLTNDYLIWTKGDDVVKTLMTHEPTESELNNAASLISDTEDVKIAKCLFFNYSHDRGGSYYTHLVKGMGEDKRFVYSFSFDGACASEPTLEAWDDSDHDSTDKHVLGAGTPANSMVKAVCTTDTLPGASWVGTAIAGDGATRKINLNNGNGALGALPSGQTTQELYANIRIQVPMGYSTPSIESFALCVRFTYN